MVRLGREARYVTEVARRIANFLLLGPALDKNYEVANGETWGWPVGVSDLAGSVPLTPRHPVLPRDSPGPSPTSSRPMRCYGELTLISSIRSLPGTVSSAKPTRGQ